MSKNPTGSGWVGGMTPDGGPTVAEVITDRDTGEILFVAWPDDAAGALIVGEMQADPDSAYVAAWSAARYWAES